MKKEKDVVVIDGQEERNWRGALDDSDLYIAIVSKHFSEDTECIEQTIYAKERKIPTILLWREGVESSIPDLFDGMNIVAEFIFNDENFEEMVQKLKSKVQELKNEKNARVL